MQSIFQLGSIDLWPLDQIYTKNTFHEKYQLQKGSK